MDHDPRELECRLCGGEVGPPLDPEIFADLVLGPPAPGSPADELFRSAGRYLPARPTVCLVCSRSLRVRLCARPAAAQDRETLGDLALEDFDLSVRSVLLTVDPDVREVLGRVPPGLSRVEARWARARRRLEEALRVVGRPACVIDPKLEDDDFEERPFLVVSLDGGRLDSSRKSVDEVIGIPGLARAYDYTADGSPLG